MLSPNHTHKTSYREKYAWLVPTVTQFKSQYLSTEGPTGLWLHSVDLVLKLHFLVFILPEMKVVHTSELARSK